MLLRGDETSCDGRIPTATDIGLIIEVSDSTLGFDRRDKGRIYSRAGIPVYWIINVAERQIEVYTNPDTTANPPEYATRLDYLPDDIVPITLDGVAVGTIAVTDLLP